MPEIISQFLVIISRVLLGVALVSAACAVASFIVGKINGSRLKRKQKALNKNNTTKQAKEVNLEQEKTEEKQEVMQNALEDSVINNMRKEAESVGLQKYEYGNFSAYCNKDEWITFVQNLVNEGALEKSKDVEYLVNFSIYNNNELECLLEGDKEELVNALVDENVANKYDVKIYDSQTKKEYRVKNNTQSTPIKNEPEERLIENLEK